MELYFSKTERAIFEKVANAAQDLNMKAFLIGGYVRDKFLGRKSKDADIVCLGDGIMLAQQVAAQFEPQLKVAVFKNFGTAQMKLPDGFEIEFVGARKESYTLDSRKPQVSSGSLEDDQNRRDFTINALALPLQDNSLEPLIDPFEGLNDLEQKIIRTPLNPDITFSDDPLRMMRAIRFATQLNFTIEENTLNAISRNKDRLKIISQERISDELQKIILSKKPSIGFELLWRTGLLEIFFPQLVALAGVEIVEGKGHKDNFFHTLQVLDNVAIRSNKLWLRWAALLHDIAKPATKKFENGHGWTFHGHEVVGRKMCKGIFKQLKLPLNEPLKYVEKLVALHLRPISLTKEEITDAAMRRLLFDAGEDLEDLMLLCESDITSKNKFKVKRFIENFQLVTQRLKEVEEKDKIRNWQPPIDGAIVMRVFQLNPSREVGLIKTAVREAILDGVIPNEYDAAYQLMLKTAAQMGIFPKGEN